VINTFMKLQKECYTNPNIHKIVLEREIMETRFFIKIKKLYRDLNNNMKKKYNRHVSFGDLITDRWETAKDYGFGEGTSCYDNVLIIGDVKVGKNTWIGPNVILDGSGGLEIGDNCTICAGVQIYTHNSIKKGLSDGELEIERKPVKIGSKSYIGPQSVVEKGVTIGNEVVIGSFSFVNSDIPSKSRAWGIPARIQTTMKDKL